MRRKVSRVFRWTLKRWGHVYLVPYGVILHSHKSLSHIYTRSLSTKFTHASMTSRAMDNTFDKTATETIDLFEARLRRIEYAVCGQNAETSVTDGKLPVAQRLASLERALHQVASKSKTVQDLLRIR